MAIKVAKNARIQYKWAKCHTCNQVENAATVKNGECIQCRADRYGIAPHMVLEFEIKQSKEV